MTATDRAFIKAYARRFPVAAGEVAEQPLTAAPAESTGIREAVPEMQAPSEPPVSGGANPPTVSNRTAEPGAGAGEKKRPLSNWLSEDRHPSPPANGLEEALGVRRFRWPTASRRLLERNPAEFGVLAEMLLHRAEQQGTKLLVVSGLCRGEGRTTMLTCIAQRIAQTGARLALVDADFHAPRLAAALGVTPPVGWQDMLQGTLPLEEVLIHSEADGTALLPLRSAVEDGHSLAGKLKTTISLGMLRENYDLVLVDAGPLLAENSTAAALVAENSLDSGLLVCDVRRASTDRLAAAAEILTSARIPVLGVIENFCVPQSKIPGATAAAEMNAIGRRHRFPLRLLSRTVWRRLHEGHSGR